MKIDIRKNLPMYISVIVCIVLYIAAFATSSLFYPEYAMSDLSLSLSVGFLLSFYIMTYYLATNKVFCTAFSIYFFVVMVLLICSILITVFYKEGPRPSWYMFIGIPMFIIYASYIKPIAQFLEFTLDILKDIFGKENGDFLGYVLMFTVCILFYVVCFTTRYFKNRKLKVE